MDLLALVGLLLGLVAIAGGQFLEGGQLGALINGPAFFIVLGGSLGAVLLQSPMPVFLRALKVAPWVFRPPLRDEEATLRTLIEWSAIARKEGLLGLEPLIESIPEPFVRKGLELLVDGSEPAVIRDVLEVDLDGVEQHDMQAARFFEAMGGYCPTVGIIAAVLGLIHVMQNLADPARLGSGIATAFVATIYGVGFANLILLPVANKLKALIRAQSRYHEMIIEGFVSIAEGENPRYIESKLRGFLQQ